MTTTNTKGQRLGYIRVSTGKQDERLQHDALDKVGVLKRNRYTDHGVSGAKTSRPQLDAMLDDAEPGDISGFERACLVFDGRDATALESARSRWKQAKDAGISASYWKESASGRWEKQQ